MTRQANHGQKPLRVLFLCTANASRSQIAEALLTIKGRGRFEAASAGSEPAAAVHPLAISALQEIGIEWTGRLPKGLDAVLGEHWDFVITVCERARESCPALPGKPVYADWSFPDPTAVEDGDARWMAFRTTVQDLVAADRPHDGSPV